MVKRRNQDLVYTWFDHNIDLESRTIYMGSAQMYEDGESGVDNFMAENFIKGMHVLERSPDKDINIVMNNPGGDWYHGMAIFDSIKNSPCYCSIKVYGHAMSMGSIILQAGDNRILMPNSRLMIHYGYNGSYGHTKIFEKWADEGKKLNYEMENVYLDSMIEKEAKEGSGHLSKHLTNIVNDHRSLEVPKPDPVDYKFSKSTSIKREEIRVILRELLNFDTILSPIESVNIGLADEVYKLEK